MSAFWKIEKRWVQEWGLTPTECLVLAEMMECYECSVTEHAERINLSRVTFYSSVKKLYKKCKETLHTECKETLQNVLRNFTLEKKKKEKASPTPPIKRKNKKGEERRNFFPNAAASGAKKTSLKEAEKKQKKDPPPSPPPYIQELNTRCREYFEQEYLRHTNEHYYWDAADAGALPKLLRKIIFTMSGGIKDVKITPENIPDLETNYQALVTACFTSHRIDGWIKDNLSPKIINSKFNEIYKQIKNGRTQPNRYQSDIDDQYVAGIVADIAGVS